MKIESNFDSHLPTFAGGIILGCILAGIAFLISRESHFQNWIYDHEALSAGLAGVFAAAFTTLILIWQIRQNHKFREDSRNRRLNAATSTLSLALADYSDYASECLLVCVKMARGRDFSPAMPKLVDNHLNVLKECIEDAPSEIQSKLRKLISLYQVQRSRLHGEIQEYDVAEWHPQKYIYSGALYSSMELVLEIQEHWAFARSDDSLIISVPKSERTGNLLLLYQNELPDNWDEFIRHFRETVDRPG